jgi:hypothetical protein
VSAKPTVFKMHAIQNEQQNKDSYVAAGAEGSV